MGDRISFDIAHDSRRRTTPRELLAIVGALVVIGALVVLVLVVVRLLRPEPPAANAVPLVGGTRVIASVKGPNEVSGTGSFRYVVVEGPGGYSAGLLAAAEVRYLERRGWRWVESVTFDGVPPSSMRPRHVAPGAPGAMTKLFGVAENFCTEIAFASTEGQLNMTTAPQLLGVPVVRRALSEHRPLLSLVLSSGHENCVRGN